MFNKQNKYEDVFIIKVQRGEKIIRVRTIYKNKNKYTNIEKIGILEISKNQILEMGATVVEK